MNGLLITTIVLLVAILIINLIILVQVRIVTKNEQIITRNIINFALNECRKCRFKEEFYAKLKEKGKAND